MIGAYPQSSDFGPSVRNSAINLLPLLERVLETYLKDFESDLKSPDLEIFL